MSGRRQHIEWAVFLTVFLDLMGHGVVVPLVPYFVAFTHGSAAATSGLLVASFSLMQLVAAPLLGRASDRYGRRPVLLLSLAGNVVGLATFTLGVHYRLLPLLFVGRMLGGITAGNLATCQAIMADISTPEQRPRAMGRIGAAVGLGFVAGPVLGGMLSTYGYTVPTLVACGLVALDLLIAFLVVPETKVAPAKPKLAGVTDTLAGSRGALAAVLFLFFSAFVMISTAQVAFPLTARDSLHWSPQRVGLVYATVGLILLVVQAGLVGRLSRAFGVPRLLLVGTTVSACGMALLWRGAGIGSATVAGLWIFALGYSLSYPLLSSLAVTVAGPARQGFVLGLAQSVGAVARAIGPASAGFVYQWAGPSAPFAMAAALGLAGFVVARVYTARGELRAGASPGHT